MVLARKKSINRDGVDARSERGEDASEASRSNCGTCMQHIYVALVADLLQPSAQIRNHRTRRRCQYHRSDTMVGSSIPSIEDILASDHILSASDTITKVVKIREQFAVKYGRRVSYIEAENLKFLADSDVPVPKLYGFLTAPEGEKSFIIIELVEGQTLEQILPSLTTAEKDCIFEQIRKALALLRGLKPPDYTGAIGRKPLGDGIFRTESLEPRTNGPFATEAEMNESIIRRLAESCAPSHLELLRKVIESTLQGHKTVFTHGHLQPRNIMVHRKAAKEDGSAGGFEIKIVDWEMSGWYPEYWEFCNASIWDSWKPDWLEGVQKIVTVYAKEYLMMKLIRSIVFQLG